VSLVLDGGEYILLQIKHRNVSLNCLMSSQNIFLLSLSRLYGRWDNSVGIATRYGLDGPGFEAR